jgi:hypothetical protein
MSNYVIRICKSRNRDRSRKTQSISQELIRGLLRRNGVDLTYTQSPSREYPLTFVCGNLDNPSVTGLFDALEKLRSIRTEVAVLLEPSWNLRANPFGLGPRIAPFERKARNLAGGNPGHLSFRIRFRFYAQSAACGESELLRHVDFATVRTFSSQVPGKHST